MQCIVIIVLASAFAQISSNFSVFTEIWVTLVVCSLLPSMFPHIHNFITVLMRNISVLSMATVEAAFCA
jgi:hypothetical protein